MKLLDDSSGEAVADSETTLIALDEIEHQAVGRQIALTDNLLADFLVARIVEVAGVAVEDRVAPQSKRLMNLRMRVTPSSLSVLTPITSRSLPPNSSWSLMRLEISSTQGLQYMDQKDSNRIQVHINLS